MDCEDPIKKYLYSISQTIGIQDREPTVLAFTKDKNALKEHFFVKSKCTQIEEIPSREDCLILTFRNEMVGQTLNKELREFVTEIRSLTIVIKPKNIIDNVNNQLNKLGINNASNVQQIQQQQIPQYQDNSFQQQQMSQSVVFQQEQHIPEQQIIQQQEVVNNQYQQPNIQQTSAQKPSGDPLNMLIKTCLINPVNFEQLFNELKIRNEWELVAVAVKNEQLLRRVIELNNMKI